MLPRPENNRRNAATADISPRCSKAARIKVACASLTQNIGGACGRKLVPGKPRLHDQSKSVSASHHLINALRAKPVSPRQQMRVFGQQRWIRATMRAISSTAPAAFAKVFSPGLCWCNLLT